jgi:hypothetical protein
MPQTSSTRLKSPSLRLSSQSRTTGSSSKSYRRRILLLTLGQIAGQQVGAAPSPHMLLTPGTRSVRSSASRARDHPQGARPVRRGCILGAAPHDHCRPQPASHIGVRSMAGLAIGDRIGSWLSNISLANEIPGEPDGEPNPCGVSRAPAAWLFRITTPALPARIRSRPGSSGGAAVRPGWPCGGWRPVVSRPGGRP